MSINDSSDDYYSSNAFNFLKKPSKDSLNNENNSNKNVNNNNQVNEKNITGRKIPRDAQFLNKTKSAYEKSIKDSNKAIYEEPVPNYDGYLAKGNFYNIIFNLIYFLINL